MPSVRYMNNSAPFWDWVASLEQDGAQHPWFSQWNQSRNDESERERGGETREHQPFGPWGWGFPFAGGHGFPYRGPPPHHDNERDERKESGDNNAEAGDGKGTEDNNDNGEGPSGSGSESEGRRRRHGRGGPRHGQRGCGGHRGFGGPGPHHGPRGHHDPHGRHGPHGPHGPHSRRGGFGPPGRGGFGPFFNPWAFASSFLDPLSDNNIDSETDFTPEADIFDTPTSFVVHVSLPGAKKEDVGVNWDVEKSELSIAGVIYRPGDEEFLKTLATDERKTGPFERKVRLGTRANPAAVDADGISAKLEDGVLRVEVPKLGDNGFVEVRKVDIE